ncbi:hypothetical protein HYU13_04170 [Candidatus Woesearchaeota archaeon]|nr:hypothetical protein [Candidatus Woesearchaeota archaeon]
MVSLTTNEARVVNFLTRHTQERNSINALGKRLHLSPMGIHKILKKLERQRVVMPENIGNSAFYHINFSEEIAEKYAELALLEKSLNPYAAAQANDLKPLQPKVSACMLFGSILTRGKEAGDIDILVVINKEQYKEVKMLLNKVQEIKPKRLHEMVQTKEDLIGNIKKNDPPILAIIQQGAVLWGAQTIVEAIKHGSS